MPSVGRPGWVSASSRGPMLMAFTLQWNSRDPLSHTLCSMAWAWYKERTQVILYSNRLAEDSDDPPRADMNTYTLLIVDVHGLWDAMSPQYPCWCDCWQTVIVQNRYVHVTEKVHQTFRHWYTQLAIDDPSFEQIYQGCPSFRNELRIIFKFLNVDAVLFVITWIIILLYIHIKCNLYLNVRL